MTLSLDGQAVRTEIEYARRGTRALIGTLYRGAGTRPSPALIAIHGGAWTSGGRDSMDELATELCEAGAIVLAIEFRMPPEAAYPAALDDARAAIGWLQQHATELNTSRIAVLGSSSGGQTALLCALQPELGQELDFIVTCWPIADPLARYRMARERSNAKLIAAHEAYFRDEATMLAASPQQIVEAGGARSLPPLLIVQGTADENVTPEMAPNFAAAYERAGGSVALHLFPGQPHSFIKGEQTAATIEAKRLIVDFVRKQSGQS